MSPENFVYWLQGFVELQPNPTVSERQWQIIKDHLQEVFKKNTPIREQPTEDEDERNPLIC